MITTLLQNLVCERFKTDSRYREGHLRVVNALPQRKILGLHSPEMKQVAKELWFSGCNIDHTNQTCINGQEVIHRFEQEPSGSLCYEETVIWGFLINLAKCTLEERFAMLERYVPVMDNWAVCDSYCANAKWMARADKGKLWEFLQQWFDSEREFEVRFAVICSMCYFLQEEWLEQVFKRIDSINFEKIKSEYKTVKRKPAKAQEGTVQGSEPYYVRMGVAWLLATALAKFEEPTREFVRTSQLPSDVIKLYVRKARESFRTRNVAAI